TPDDKNILMTAEARFDKNSDVKTLNAERLRGQIVPTPQHVKIHGQNVSLEKGVQLDIAALDKPAQEAIFARFALLGIKTDAGYPVRTAIASHAFSGKEAVSGAYQLHIGPKETTITG
ncbi:glycoside hydrolase family 20 zincin-like fold domain-containing protein, partial [Salmonella enterica]